LSHIYLLVAIMTLGFTAFPMAPRNNAETTVNLLKATGASYMFVEPGGAINELAEEVAGLLVGQGTEITLLPMVKFQDLTVDDQLASSMRPQKVNDSDAVLILHSSGRERC
jgi:hypothetical protein